jgi:hypothetical protein
MEEERRMKQLYLFRVFGILGCAILLAACNLAAPTDVTPTQDETAIAQMVAATLTAAYTPESPSTTPQRVATQAATASAVDTPIPSKTLTLTVTPTQSATPSPSATFTLQPTSTPVTGNVTGAICYPSEGIPAMTAYFQETTSDAIVELPITEGQSEYTIDLPPGKYIAYAWLPDFSYGGLYSKAVPCGLRKSCTDHAALPITVAAGNPVKGVDICDWYTGPFIIPYPPGKEPEQTTGSISGQISYPFGAIPALQIVAFNTRTGFWYWTGTVAGSAYYSITDLPPGPYQVVAYTGDGKAGGYADASHKLITVTVKAGEDVSAGITDWDGSYPANPIK